MKKLISIILTIITLLSLVGCGKTEQFNLDKNITIKESDGTTWNIDSFRTKEIMPDDVAKIFNNATDDYNEIEFKPVAYIGKNESNEMYRFVCTGTTNSDLSTIKLYVLDVSNENVESPSISETRELEIYQTMHTAQESSEYLMSENGWTIYNNQPEIKFDDYVQQKYQELSDYCSGGYGFTPIAYLGSSTDFEPIFFMTQENKLGGTIYAFLSKVEIRNEIFGEGEDIALVTFYVYDDNKTPMIINIYNF